MHRGKKLEWTGQVFRNLDCSVRLIRNVLAVLSSSPHAKLGKVGLVRVYNHLPKSIVEGTTSVSQFQSLLQGLVKQRASAGHADWQLVFSPRVCWRRHPLVHLLESIQLPPCCSHWMCRPPPGRSGHV